jgi:hypothetical protein
MNHKNVTLLAMACSMPFMTGSCDDHVIGHGQPIVLNCRREPPLTYENFGEGILGRHCTSCHSAYVRQGQRANAPVGVDFDTWENVLDWAERIKVRSVDLDDMPPAGGMVQDERIELEEWLRCEVLPAKGQFLPEDTGAPEAES